MSDDYFEKDLTVCNAKLGQAEYEIEQLEAQLKNQAQKLENLEAWKAKKVLEISRLFNPYSLRETNLKLTVKCILKTDALKAKGEPDKCPKCGGLLTFGGLHDKCGKKEPTP